MLNIFFWLTLVIAAVDWFAVVTQNKKLEYIAKPGTMVALLAWLLTAGGVDVRLLPFILGILFSLAGDIFLMLPKEQFIAGLVAFLLAQVAYTFGFNIPLVNPGLPAVGLAVVLALAVRQIYSRLSPGLTGDRQKLRLPVLVYALVISAMLFSALLTLLRGDWVIEAAVLASVGAFLFYISDTILALNKFVTPMKYGRLINIITYHLGQIGIIAGAILHYLTVR